MKKVWIASILTCIILMLPITNVVGANEVVDEDCLECQPVNRVDLLKVRILLKRIEAFVNIMSLKFNHIPEVKEKCQEVSDEIIALKERVNDLNFDSLSQDNDIYCNILISIALLLFPIGLIIEGIWEKFPKNLILRSICYFIGNYINALFLIIILYSFALGCWDYPYLSPKYHILNKQFKIRET